MTDDDPIAERLLRMAPLEIPPAYAEGGASGPEILAGHAAIFTTAPLPDTVEPAPVFRP